MPEPLSALLMTRVGSELSFLRALFCEGVRFGVVFRGDNALTSLFILCRYASISGEAGGGFHKLFSLKGCIVAGCLFLKKKKSFNLLFVGFWQLVT